MTLGWGYVAALIRRGKVHVPRGVLFKNALQHKRTIDGVAKKSETSAIDHFYAGLLDPCATEFMF